MPEAQGLTISGKNITVWLAIATIVVGSIVDSALTRSQVGRNTKILETYNLPIIDYKMNEMDKKLDRVLILLGEE